MANSRTSRAPVREAEVRTDTARTIREPERAARVRHGAGTSKLDIPRDILDRLGREGWDLQWNVDSILGKPETQARMAMEMQGWRSITPDMWDGLFDGMFTRKGHVGEILVEGLVLQARPMENTLAARADELANARQARHAEEAKLRTGNVDGVDHNMLSPNDAKARANTFLRKERVPSMPVP